MRGGKSSSPKSPSLGKLMVKKTIRIVAGLLISLVFLWLAFRKSDLSQVWGILKTMRIDLIIVVFVISVLSLMLRSLRWKTLGKEYHNVSWKNCFEATSIGLMLNNFVPFRGGDLFQGYFLAKKSGLPKSYTMATVFLERIIDFFPPLIMIVAGSFFVVLPEQIKLSRIFLLLFILFALIYLFISQRKRFINIIQNFMHHKHSERIDRFLDNLAKAILFIKDRQVITQSVPLTLLNWFVLTSVTTFLTLKAVGIQLNFLAVFLVLGISIMSVAIPSSPGFVGTWEFFTMLALSIFKIDRDRALSYAVISHFMALLPATIFGLYYFYLEMFVRKEKIDISEKA